MGEGAGWALVAACLVCATPLFAATAQQAGPLRLLRNDHLTASFDTRRGGFLSGLAGADGKVWLDSGNVYTDHGLFEEGRYVGSTAVPDAKVTTATENGLTTLTSEGLCRGNAGDERPAAGLRYRLAARLGDDAALALSCRVWLDHDRPAPAGFGFLAALFGLPQVSEWAADTVDGRVNEVFAGDGRSFQSSQLPFAPGQERLTIVYLDGRILTVDQPHAERGPLANVFLHYANHGAALFLAFLDGEAGAWPADEPWEWQATLRLGG